MNKVVLIGRLCANPDVRYANSNGEQLAIARYTLAVDRKGKDSGADFINCVAFGRQGEFAEKYLSKGMKMGVEGRIQTGSYTNKDGQKVFTTDVVIENQEFVESKRSENEQAQSPQSEPTQAVPDGFMNIPEDIENDLPFKG